MGQVARSVLVLAAVSVAIAGCNQEQPPVIRVQRNVVDKSVFQGDWYYLQTVIDTPYSAGYTFVGEQGPTEKITWEIQENYLIARRSYEHIAGSEPEGIAGSTERGAAVAMYAIESHFDIRCEYSPTTGECMNVIVENTTDRPWDERQYMRVDWSQNLITNNEFLVLARIFDGIEMEPVSYYVQDPDDPHAPKFVADEPGGEVNYIDIVNKMFIRPTTVDIEGLGPVPSCYLLYQDHLDCAPGEITVRNSFLKVDPEDDDYQPFVYTGDRMDRFGYFVTERAGYDPHYGVVEPARFRFANRHNIWRQSHQRDADGGLLRCTEATAEMVCGGHGATCDIDWARAHHERTEDGEWNGACTIPYREREVKPIVYHVSRSFPEDLLPDVEHVAQEWSQPFIDTVASLRENECLADGVAPEDCASERDREAPGSMFVFCHNPVKEEDSTECGPPGTSAEIGDLRYSLLGWVTEPHASSPLGYGPSSADPETGEIIMGNAFIYGAPLETLAAFARDIVALLNNDLAETDISSGQVVQDWVEHQMAPGSSVTGRPADDHAVPVDGYNVDRINAAMDFSWASELGSAATRARPSSPREMLDRFDESLHTLTRNGAFGSGEERGQARLSNLMGTDIERMMTGPEMRMAAGVDPSLPISDGVLELASPLRGMSLASIHALDRAKAQIQRQGCVLSADFADDGMLGLAREIKREADTGTGTMTWYGRDYDIVGGDGHLDYEAVRDMLRHPILDGVLAHEVGHTLGLRHNFSGSYDSLNYRPRYWELRDDGDMQPRAWDPLSEAEINGRIREAQYSTVMDYGNNFVVTDSAGIGHWDSAAIKMGYGDLVEVFDNAADPREMSWVSFIQSAGWPVRLKLAAFTGGTLSAYSYTDVPTEVLGGVDRIEQRSDVPYTSLVADPFLASQGIDDRLEDPRGRPAVPYLFCSDEQADLDADCLRYDAGADRYETLTSVIDAYWNYYIFNAFRRGRIGFNTDSYASRILGRYFEKLQYANQIYSLFRGVFTEIFGDGPDLDRFMERPDGMGAFTAGVGASFSLLTQVITAPEPGRYGTALRGDGSRALLSGGSSVNVDDFDGRSLETTWDFDAGYFWFDQLERAGYYYDKVLALMVLADPETHFLGRDTAADVRRYQISFDSDFGPSLSGFMRGLLGEDWESVAPRVDPAGSIVYPDPLSLADGGMDGVPLDPNASFSIQLYAAAYGMALIPDTYDQRYLSSARIFVRGGAEGVDIDPSVPTVELTDPETGLTYVAASYPDADGVERGVGAQMLQHAQALVDHGADGELRRFIDNIDVVRRLSWLLAYGD